VPRGNQITKLRDLKVTFTFIEWLKFKLGQEGGPSVDGTVRRANRE